MSRARGKKAMDAAKVLIAKRPAPIFVSLALTHRCNLHCGYCGLPDSPSEPMPESRLIEVLDDLAAAGLWRVSLTGGEPLLSHRFERVIEHLRFLGVTVTVNTNGQLVEPKISALQKVDAVSVSIDGPEKIHDEIRGAGSYRKAAAAVSLLKEKGIAVSLSAVLATHNVGAVYDLVRMAAGLDVPISFQPVWPKKLGDAGTHEYVPGKGAMGEAIARLLELKKQGAPILNSQAALRHFISWPEGRDIGCLAGLATYRLEPDGTFTGCERTEEKAVWIDLKKESVKSALAQLPRSGCSRCFCAAQVDLQLASRLVPSAIRDLFLRKG